MNNTFSLRLSIYNKRNNMQNFGKLRNAFNEVLTEGIVNGDISNKTIFKKYIKQIKENEILKTQFMVYENISNKFEDNEKKAELYINENIKLLDKFSKKEINESNKNLMKLLSSPDYSGDYDKIDIHEDITTLIFKEKNVKNVDSIIESTMRLINHMKGNTKVELKESIDLPQSMILAIIVEKFNKKYSEIDSSDKEIIKIISEGDTVSKTELYERISSECMGIINEKIKDSDIELKVRLLNVKEKLLKDDKVIDEDYTKKLLKLVELRDNLK